MPSFSMVATIVAPFIGPPLSEWMARRVGSTPSALQAASIRAAAKIWHSVSCTTLPTTLRLKTSTIMYR